MRLEPQLNANSPDLSVEGATYIPRAGVATVGTDGRLVDPALVHSPNGVRALIDLCSRDSWSNELKHWVGKYLFALPLGVSSLFLLEFDQFQLAAVAAGVSVASLIAVRQMLKNGCARDAQMFSECGPEAVPDLINALTFDNERVQAVAAMVLAQILPAVGADTFAGLTDSARDRLFAWLTRHSRRFSDQRITIISALGNLKAFDAIPYLESFSRRTCVTPTSRRIRTAARSALTFLVAQADERENQEIVAVAAEIDDDLESSEEAKALYRKLRKHSESHAAPGMRYGFLIANWCVITPFTVLQFIGSVVNKFGLPINLCWAVLSVLSTQLYRVALTGKETRMARELAALDDVHAIGPLSEALEWPDYEMRNLARTALIRLLPRMKASDSMILNSRQRRCLNNQLILTNAKNYLDCELQIKILTALQYVGDLSSLQAVKQLLLQKPTLSNERKVHRIAATCLPMLEQRAHLNEGSQMLLRASSATDMGVETLVRPARSSNIPPEEMLRPAEPQKDKE